MRTWSFAYGKTSFRTFCTRYVSWYGEDLHRDDNGDDDDLLFIDIVYKFKIHTQCASV